MDENIYEFNDNIHDRYAYVPEDTINIREYELFVKEPEIDEETLVLSGLTTTAAARARIREIRRQMGELLTELNKLLLKF